MSFGLMTFTLVHVALSLIGIGTGFVVLYGLLSAKRFHGWTALFLATTVATSATGFGFPADRFLPSHAIGILSLVVLAVAVYARYARQLAGAWRPTYVISAVVAQYFNVFVLVVQAFLKVPALKSLAPTQTEPAFAMAQLVVLLSFVVVGLLATLRSRGETISAV